MTDCKPPILPGLAPFAGSEHWYRHGLVRNVFYTDGARYVAETGGAYWLLDEIALAQNFQCAVQDEEFQVWKLTVRPDNIAIWVCEDGNGRVLLSKTIPFTDFPARGVIFYCCNRTILLPGEY